MFIWDFVASTVLDAIIDWFYGQVVGFLGNFFAEMGNMGVELFQQNWVQSIVLFFSYLACPASPQASLATAHPLEMQPEKSSTRSMAPAA